MGTGQTWVLAFDASCGTCSFLADVVAQECGERLEIRPLTDNDVTNWRHQALGEEPGWAPTLLRIDGDQVRAWTGARMAARLVRRLGLRSTGRLLRTLGELKHRSKDPTSAPEGIGRKDFLKLGAGATVAAGLVLLGKTPAFADPVQRWHDAHSWAAANLDKLPRDYDGLARLDLTYRKAIHNVLSAGDRSRLWVEHLTRFRSARAELSAQQVDLLDRAIDLAGDDRTFTPAGRDELHPTLEELKVAAIAAFGADDSRALLTNLGPAVAGDHAARSSGVQAACSDCQCNPSSNWCGGIPGDTRCCPTSCYSNNRTCNCTESGCGSFWSYACKGRCGAPNCTHGRCG